MYNISRMGKSRMGILCKLMNKNLLFPSLQTLVSSPQCIWELEHHHRSLEDPISDPRDFCRNLLSLVCLVDLGDLDSKKKNMKNETMGMSKMCSHKYSEISTNITTQIYTCKLQMLKYYPMGLLQAFPSRWLMVRSLPPHWQPSLGTCTDDQVLNLAHHTVSLPPGIRAKYLECNERQVWNKYFCVCKTVSSFVL